MIFDALGSLALGQPFDVIATAEEIFMAVLTDAELAAMRGDTELLMPDTCNIVSLTNTSDGEGGWTETRGTTGTSICRLDVIQGREQLTGGAIQPYISYMLSLPYDVAVTPAQIVEHLSVDYAVKSINRGQSWKAVVRVELERINA
jgi:hypothetical protein